MTERAWTKLGRVPDFDAPKRLTDKIHWFKWRGNLGTLGPLVDKLQVKPIVSALIGSEHVLPAIATWTKAADFRWEDVPPNCILKATHTSGCNAVVRNPSAAEARQIAGSVAEWFERRYEFSHYEVQYRHLAPTVIAEPLIELPEGTFYDFKYFCLNGEIAAIQALCYEPKTSAFYDVNWQRLPVEREDLTTHQGEVPRPDCLDELTRATRLLARDFPFVRVDWMVSKDQWYFGELTFCPTNGLFRFVPDDVDFEWGARVPLRAYRNPFPSRS